jgi:hypothetical protein
MAAYTRDPVYGLNSTLNITTSTLIKGPVAIPAAPNAPIPLPAGPGVLATVSVIVAGTTAGTLNDIDSVGNVATANVFFTIPNSVGIWQMFWPFNNGLVVVPGTGQTVAVSWS